MEPLHIYTDGASVNDKGKDSCAGVAFYIVPKKKLKRKSIHGTNNIAELIAVDYALYYVSTVLKSTAPIVIHTDSRYAIGILEKGWNAKLNVELIEKIRSRMSALTVSFEYVEGHKGVVENELVDKAAKKAMIECKNK